MTGIVQQLLNFARRSTPKQTLCDLNHVIDLTINLMEPIIKKRTRRFQLRKDSRRELPSTLMRLRCSKCSQIY